MSTHYDVIIAGAGPIGLFLACELGLRSASVLVLERDARPKSLWKVEPLGVRGLNTSSVESLYRRGLLGKLFELETRPLSYQKRPGFQFGGHFAGVMLDANKFELDRWKYRLPGPALLGGATTIDELERLLSEHAVTLDIDIRRGCGVTNIDTQDANSVRVEAGDLSFHCKWLVGCDGGRSMVRKLAGFDFVGTDPQLTGYAVSCDWDHPEKLKPGFHVTDKGMHIIRPPNALYMMDFDGGAFNRTSEITQEHVQELFNRMTGETEIHITKIHIASSFTDRCKQATSYRKGRVLLAGDAAHIHSPLGAQGLNTGLGDAMNLGWKLAATIRQELDGQTVDLTLLDTYEKERHPIGAKALEWTRVQVSMLQPNPYGAALQTLIRDIIDTTDGTNLFIDRFMGLSQRYHLGEGGVYAHPLLGCSAPDLELLDGSRLGPKLENGGGLLVDLENDAALEQLLAEEHYESKVDLIRVDAKEKLGLRAMLIRPDGVVAWLAVESEEADVGAAKVALRRWFAC